MSITRRLLCTTGLAAAVALVATPGLAQKKMYGPGVTDKEIKIGNTNPYSGPASAYGTIGRTIAAYFKKVNAEGGINGRKIKFVTLDDGYSPPKTVEQTRKLVEREKVLFIFQGLGTPTNSAIHKYMNKKKVPQLFVATGATKWGQPKKFPWTMGWQPNYQTEGSIYAKYVLKNVKNPKIAVLYQNDDYGKDYLIGLRAGLGAKAKGMIVKALSYEVSSPTVDAQVVQLKNSGANVFLNVTTPKFAVQAIKKAHDLGWKPLHFLNNVSVSVSRVMKPAGFEKSQGIISSAYAKDPTDPQWKNDKEYLEWVAFMKKWYPRGSLNSSFNSYGYAVAKTMVHVLKQAGDNLTRKNIMKTAASMKDVRVPMLLPGVLLNTGPGDFRPIEQMQLQRFEGKTWKLFGPIIDASGSS
jgi:branched-chain amino acid transport system substrate-binding protein